MKRYLFGLGLSLSLAAGAATKVEFQSNLSWSASRWYLLGQVRAGTVEWLSGERSKLKFQSPACEKATNSAITEAKLKDANSEVLTAAGGWIAVQVDPAERKDSLELHFDKDCRASTNLVWSPGAGEAGAGVLVPYLFLKPQSNVYMGQEFVVHAPAASQSTDILLDVVGGAWNLNLGNSSGTAKSKLLLAPVVEARGEWQPSALAGVGFELHMLQALASLGGVEFQDVLVSEWMAGMYYQKVFSVAQGLVFRLHMDFFQHLADQGTDVVSLAPYETNHRGVNLGLSFAQYFAKRWHIQLRADYGYPSRLSGAGTEQSYLRFKGHVGVLVTDAVTWLIEGGYRTYGYTGHNSTTALSGAMGLRLEL
ncbi:MAG TPA: hypothetical protein VM901_12000 [Bdellovibrionota bacterium]|jgi:hypothetical protein|nr:hypothetical protein [Bdellovibrionota bacterium]